MKTKTVCERVQISTHMTMYVNGSISSIFQWILFNFFSNMVIVIITIIIINIILIIIIIIAIICINIVNIGKISFTSLYIQLDKSLALTIGAEKELLFFGGVNYSVDEVLILPDCSSSSKT